MRYWSGGHPLLDDVTCCSILLKGQCDRLGLACLAKDYPFFQQAPNWQAMIETTTIASVPRKTAQYPVQKYRDVAPKRSIKIPMSIMDSNRLHIARGRKKLVLIKKLLNRIFIIFHSTNTVTILSYFKWPYIERSKTSYFSYIR
jgi:hypothetical protein